MKLSRILTTTVASVLAATSLVACSSSSEDAVNSDAAGSSESKEITVGTTDASKKGWAVFEEEAKKAGFNIKVTNFGDYNTPNQALEQGELDTNNFQHLKFLAEYNQGNNSDLVPIVATEIVPLALFWKDHTSLDGIEGQTIAVPNDSVNLGRAINVLSQAGLITLKEKGLLTPTQLDVDESKSKVKITPIDAAQTPAAYGEGKPAIINNSFLDRAGIDPTTSVFQDDPSSEEAEPYINAFVVRAEDADNEQLHKLAEVWHTDAVQKAVAEDSKGTSVEVNRTPEELQAILDRLEKQLDK